MDALFRLYGGFLVNWKDRFSLSNLHQYRQLRGCQQPKQPQVLQCYAPDLFLLKPVIYTLTRPKTSRAQQRSQQTLKRVISAVLMKKIWKAESMRNLRMLPLEEPDQSPMVSKTFSKLENNGSRLFSPTPKYSICQYRAVPLNHRLTYGADLKNGNDPSRQTREAIASKKSFRILTNCIVKLEVIWKGLQESSDDDILLMHSVHRDSSTIICRCVDKYGQVERTESFQ